MGCNSVRPLSGNRPDCSQSYRQSSERLIVCPPFSRDTEYRRLMFSICTLIPGNWYITVECICRERLVLFADLTLGKGTQDGCFIIICPACGSLGTYAPGHYYYAPNITDRAAEKTQPDSYQNMKSV